MALVILIAFVLLVAYVISYYKNVARYPKGPTPLPFIGNMHQIGMDMLHEQLDSYGKEYGECYTLFLPAPTVVITDYRHIKEALVTQGETFTGRSHLPPETLQQRNPNTGVFISDGSVWREQRRVSLKILRNFGMGKGLMEERVRGSMMEMLSQLDGMDKEQVDMFMPIQLCVGNIINETLFGHRYQYNDCERFAYYVSIVGKYFDLFVSSSLINLVQAFPWMRHLPIIGYIGYKKVQEVVGEFHDFIDKELEEQVAAFEPASEPDNYVHAYLLEMQNKQDDSSMDLTNLHANCVDFWMAGMETTSTTLRWAVKYLTKYPEIQDRVRAEILSVVGAERMPEMRDKPFMPCTTAVIAEIQRCANIVAFLGTHKAIEDAVVCGQHIPKSTIVMPQVWSVLDRDTTFSDSKEFRPDRFLMDDGKTLNKEALDRMIAFGAGKRVCAGEGLARQELFLVLTTLVQRYSFTPVGTLDMRPQFSSILVPRPYKVKLTPV